MTEPVQTGRFRHREKSAARVAAVQALYAIEVANSSAEPVLGQLKAMPSGTIVGLPNFEEIDTEHLDCIVHGVSERCRELDQAIGACLAEDWKLDRLEVVLRAILRAGAYELIALPNVPSTVVINEYVNIAHAFFAGKEPGLVNAVLDHLARSKRVQQEHDQQEQVGDGQGSQEPQ